MADSYEWALWAVEDARREYAEAEASGDYEATLIWGRAIQEAVRKLEDSFPPLGFEDYEPDDSWYR